MEKTGQPPWVRKLRRLLEQAKAKDRGLERFGAHSHQYKLAAPASEGKIQKFEERFGFRLPEEYREFLLRMGDGGAGPYYGIYGVEKLENKLSGRREKEAHLYADILPIGTQGCTFMTGLALRGLCQGQVVYYDEDCCGKPFIVREKG